MVAFPLPGQFVKRSLDQEIARLAGVRPILTVSLARNQAWLRGRAMPADAVPGRSHTRASTAYGTTRDGRLVRYNGPRTNLCLQSQTFDNASWVKSRSTVTADAIIAPDGTLTADKITETTANGTHRAYQIFSKAASAITYTLSVSLKAAERTFAQIRMAETGEFNPATVGVNLSTGEVGTPYGSGITGVSASVVSFGNGWYRLSLTGTSTTGNVLGIYVMPATGLTSGDISYAGDDTKGIYVWGAQLEVSQNPANPAATDYIPTTSAAVTVATEARDVPGRGQLDEPSRTNKCTNYNAAPNGSLTNLTKSGDAAATLTEVDDTAALLAAGLQNICPSGKVFKLDNSAGSTEATAVANGSVGNTNPHTSSVYWRGTGTARQGETTAFGPSLTLPSSYERAVRTSTPISTGRTWGVEASAGAVVYFILNQLEEGSFVTSPIVVAGASATRAADVATIDLLNPGLYDVSGQSELKSGGTISTIGTATPATYDTGTGAGVINRTDGSNNSGVLIPATSGKLFVIDIEKTGGVGSVQVRQDSVSGAVLATITTRTTLVLRLPSGSGIYISNGANGTSANFTLHSLKQIPDEQVIDYPCTIVVGVERVVDTGGVEYLLQLDNGGSTDRAIMYITAADLFAGRVVTGGAGQMDTTVSGALAVNTIYRAAVRVATNDGQQAKGGSLGTQDTSLTLPATPTSIRIGTESAGGSQPCGYISFFSIIRGGVIDGNLQRLAP